MTCEDYPCCGHTDGLGCEWVSPSEVKLCLVCAEERLDRPYHNEFDDCPAELKRERTNVPAGTICGSCAEDGDTDTLAVYKWGDNFLCGSCRQDVEEYNAYQQDRYDEEWGR